LVKKLTDRLAEVKAETVSDRIGHVEAYSLVNKFAARALVETTADRLPEIRVRIMPRY